LLDPRKYGDKVARLQSVQPLFSQGLIYAPDKTFADLVIDEVAVFPNGAYDDLTDTVSYALRYLRDMNYALQTDEQSQMDIDEQMHRSRPMPLYDV
jgi:phage terminase large subunit-like protein